MKTKIALFALLCCLFLANCRNAPCLDKPITPELSGNMQVKPVQGFPWRVVKGARVAEISPARTPRIFLQKKAL